MEPTTEIKNFINEKFSKLEKFLPGPALVDLSIEKDRGQKGGLDKFIHITCAIPKYRLVHIEQHGHFVEDTIEEAYHRFAKILRKYKEKKVDLRKAGR